jgi:hypothetical protein
VVHEGHVILKFFIYHILTYNYENETKVLKHVKQAVPLQAHRAAGG